MAFHDWSEQDFDWSGLDQAIEFIALNLKRFGRVGVRDFKEKYGQCRIYLSLGWSSLHSITHPGHCFSRYPKWLWSLDCKYGSIIVPFLTSWFILPYHKFLYRFLYASAVKKWPHLRQEILCAADYPELLKGI